MLDECKGEKFEEVISTFVLLVLKKIAKAKDPKRYEIVCSDQLGCQQTDRLLPLILAHRNSLQQQIDKHQSIQKKAEAYDEWLEQRRVSIENRHAALSNLPAVTIRQQSVGKELLNSWMGDDRWAKLILEGTTGRGDACLESPFEDGWQAVQEGRSVNSDRQTNLLEDLTSRIMRQDIRLKQWKSFQASLQKAREQEKPRVHTNSAASLEEPTTIQFDEHQALHISKYASSDVAIDGSVPPIPAHRNLLNSMQADLAALRASRSSESMPDRRPAKVVQIENFVAARRTDVEQEINAEPLAPCATLREINDAQNEEDMFDYEHRRTGKRDVLNQDSETCWDPVAGAGHQSSEGEDTNVYKLSSHSSNLRGNMLGAEGSHDISTVERGNEQTPSAKGHTKSSLVVRDLLLGSSSPQAAAYTPFARQQISPTLPETRNKPIALAKSGETSQAKLPPYLTTVTTDGHRDPSKTGVSHPPFQRAEVAIMPPPQTLLERTRQSMSLLPNPAGPGGDHSRKSMSKQLRQSQPFPVNQFETPRKNPTMDIVHGRIDSPRSGSSTPRDQLFSDEADYASVFKSRPKIALSPALSPDRSGFGLDSMLEEDLGSLTLADDY